MTYEKYFKRFSDLILSAGGLVVLSPLLGTIALCIKADSKGPVFFKQKRVGKDKELFDIYKFRTMYSETPDNIPTHMLKNPDAYITRVGAVLRKTSLDELPQIINILKGEMSVIGPRPALWNQVDLIEERDRYGANDVKPGLTGLAQISGRDELEIPVKARLDGEYVRQITFRRDCGIFIKTILSVLVNDGVQEGGTSSMGIDEDLI